jgi:hypothetical protein
MRWARSGIASALIAVMVAGTAPASSASTGPAPGAVQPAAQAVTLVTGDRVLVTAGPDGRRLVTVAPAPGRAGIGFVQRAGRDRAGRDRITVVPTDAVRLVRAGRVDPRLFDVTELIRQRVDDRSRAELPLILRYRNEAARRAASAATPGVRVR